MTLEGKQELTNLDVAEHDVYFEEQERIVVNSPTHIHTYTRIYTYIKIIVIHPSDLLDVTHNALRAKVPLNHSLPVTQSYGGEAL